jgi:hypothetical protein
VTQAYTLTVVAALAATGLSAEPVFAGAIALLLLGLGLTGLRLRSRHSIQDTSGVR